MNISLDFDGTYTKDPELWDTFIKDARSKGHKVYVVTMRYGHGPEACEVKSGLSTKVDDIYFTSRTAKKPYMRALDIWIDIWIDDQPEFILEDALINH
jgi:hypothetical protein